MPPNAVPGDAAGDSGDSFGSNDSVLVALAGGGDVRAMESLLRVHYRAIYAVCRRMTGNEADACDATQEALMAIARSLPSFNGTSKLSTWVYRLAVNASIDELRRRGRHARLVSRSPVIQVTEVYEAVEAKIDVDIALATISPVYRAPIVLRELCGLDYAEIALVLGIPDGTVRSRIARGRAAMAKALGDER